jgi:hypothetical protein
MEDKKTIYNDLSKINTRDKIIEIQGSKMDNNRKKIKTITKDLLTVRRQVEIEQDSALRKSNYIFLLKMFLTYLIILFIFIILNKQGLLPSILFTGLSSLLTFILIVIVVYNLRSVYHRESMKFDTRWFHQPIIPDQKFEDEDEQECPIEKKTLNDVLNQYIKGSGITKDTYEKRKNAALLDALESKNKEVDNNLENLKKKQDEIIRSFRTSFPMQNIEQEEINTGIIAGIKNIATNLDNKIRTDFTVPEENLRNYI